MSAERHALLIGIGRYPHVARADLEGPVNNVLRIGTLLRDRFGFPEDCPGGQIKALGPTWSRPCLHVHLAPARLYP